jgi:hypothetical protein
VSRASLYAADYDTLAARERRATIRRLRAAKQRAQERHEFDPAPVEILDLEADDFLERNAI